MRGPLLRLFIAVSLIHSASAQTSALPRTWTTTEGRTFQATLVELKGTQVTVRLGNGQLAAIGLPRLSPADQSYLQALNTPATGAAPAASPAAKSADGRGAVDKRVWPQKVEVDSRAIEVTVLSEDVANEKCVYRSRNFEFTAEDKIAPSVLKELARTFESTRSLVEALPWSIDPKPPKEIGFFPAKFFVNRDHFNTAVGSDRLGASYKINDGTFYIPFSNLGLERHGKAWAKSGKYNDTLLVMEVTRQMVANSYKLIPNWIWDGTAQYISMLPNNAGVVQAGSHERALKEYMKMWTGRGYKPSDAGSVLEVLQMPVDTLAQKIRVDDKNRIRLQFTGGLLVYYFCHLDGDGKGRRFIEYMDKIAAAREAGTATGARGSFGLAQLDTLLAGRGQDEIQKAVVEGFKKIGVKWE